MYTAAGLVLLSLPHLHGLDPSSHNCSTLMDTPESTDPSSNKPKAKNKNKKQAITLKENIHSQWGPDKNKYWVVTFIHMPNKWFLSKLFQQGPEVQQSNSSPYNSGINTASSFSMSLTKVCLYTSLLIPPEVFWCILSHNLGAENFPIAPSKRWAYLISQLPVWSLQSPKTSQKT